nr:MAG: hypothetical protein [Metapenaeopsis lamellata majanivirus]
MQNITNFKNYNEDLLNIFKKGINVDLQLELSILNESLFKISKSLSEIEENIINNTLGTNFSYGSYPPKRWYKGIKSSNQDNIFGVSVYFFKYIKKKLDKKFIEIKNNINIYISKSMTKENVNYETLIKCDDNIYTLNESIREIYKNNIECINKTKVEFIQQYSKCLILSHNIEGKLNLILSLLSRDYYLDNLGKKINDCYVNCKMEGISDLGTLIFFKDRHTN